MEKVPELLKSLSCNDCSTTPLMSYVKDTNPAFDKNSCIDNTIAYFQCHLLERNAINIHSKCKN
jgi:hypothetical protein